MGVEAPFPLLTSYGQGGLSRLLMGEGSPLHLLLGGGSPLGLLLGGGIPLAASPALIEGHLAEGVMVTSLSSLPPACALFAISTLASIESPPSSSPDEELTAAVGCCQ